MSARLVLALALAGVAALAGGAFLYRFDPATSLLFPPCPFRVATGWHCPGCGSLRAFHALLHGDAARALALNPVAILAAPLLACGALRETLRWIRGADPIRYRLPAWSIRAWVALLVGFAVLRNLPGFSWLAT